MKVLLTGSAGFIASFIARRLLERGDEVVAYAVRIRAVWHGDEQMIGLNQLDFVDCEAVVNRN